MKQSLAKSLFKRLGGKITQSVRQPSREIWIVRKPTLRATLVSKLKRAAPVVARQKNSWKTFRMACELMVSRGRSASQQVLS
jgi:hypothetical protein